MSDGRVSPLVSFRQVSARLGQKEILHDLSFDVEAGETLVLLGRSGSGKTTALKMVNGLLLPSAGQVSIEGVPTTAWDLIRLRRRIGYVIQEAGLIPHFTVAANVGLVPRLEGWPSGRIEARVLNVRVGDRLVLVAKALKLHRRQTLFNVQGFVGSTMVFHADVLGVALHRGHKPAEPAEPASSTTQEG